MAELQTLINVQEYDSRIARLDADVARLPQQIEAVQAALAEARKAVDASKARLDAARKELRTREKDLDDLAVKRSKSEARLYEVKTNQEYSAALTEIETIKTQKGQVEEEILALMERQEALTGEIRQAEAQLKTREEQARRDEATIRQQLAAAQAELEMIRAERGSVAKDLPRSLLGDYERIMKARGGLGIAAVSTASVCGGCRVSVRPQALVELRSGGLLHCESCGRFLYWQEPA